ncbi:hypothetical protein [Spirosoma radiotolerans]|uniref:ZU5 domain-containing protein n=1 Tax=Spirosoma radiotolerans TaxID=1379870 RepID=A0A0E4A040_9BACT|nr:hypothetical protein [Spirosoma radiotolerans]AKD57913.1 hypothetical protein SD10_26435 [Spirosoma radiotolerans]
MKPIHILLILLLGSFLSCQKPTDAVNPDGPSPGQPDTSTGTPTEVGQPIGTPTTKTIGKSGGTISTPDGKLTLIFPVGALAKETPITVQPIQNKAINGIGIGYQFGPDTLTLNQPITFVYHYNENELVGTTPDALGLAGQDDRHIWTVKQSAVVDKTNRTITSKAKRLDRWAALITYYQLTPVQDTVYLGQVRELTLNRCTDKEPWGNTDIKDVNVELYNRPAEIRNVRDVLLNGNSYSHPEQAKSKDGKVGFTYDSKTLKVVYTAPSDKVPATNPVIVTVQLEGPNNAQLLLSSTIKVVGESNLVINGHSYDNVTPSGGFINGHLMVTATGVDSTGKSGSISLFLNSLSIGAHPFSNDLELLEGTSISVLNGAGKGDELEGSSIYSTCLIPKTESGAIQVVKVERSNGTAKVILQLSGRVVTKHSYNAETCTVNEHKTMSVSGRLTVVARE